MALRPTTQKTLQSEKYKFTEMPNLSCSAKILFATDDFFAAAENLLKDNPPEWKEGVFDAQGKWMDGWETRRKRIGGHDYCVIRLQHPTVIHGFHLDTSFFTGNHTPKISIQGGSLTKEDEESLPPRTGETNKAALPEDIKRISASMGTEKWKILVPKTHLGAGYSDTCDTFLPISSREAWTHLRLNYHPDGGVARLRIYGIVQRTLEDIMTNGISLEGKLWDLLSLEHGGTCVGFSNAHYGHPRNCLKTTIPPNIGDGWETARRLDRPDIILESKEGFISSPGEEWAAFKLGVAGKIVKIQIDTTCFKGNFPDSCKVEGIFLEDGEQEGFKMENGCGWKNLVPRCKLGPHKPHMFIVDTKAGEKVSHIRVTMAPDGGIARIRVWGIPMMSK